MKVTRRQFMKTVAASAAALGLSQLQVAKLAEVFAESQELVNVIWLQGQNCTGCTTSFAGLEWDGSPDALGDNGDVRNYLNSVTFGGASWPATLPAAISDNDVTTFDDVALDILNIQYNSTVMATAGEAAHDLLQHWMGVGGWTQGYRNVLIVEGSIPINNEKYCSIGSPLDLVGGVPDELYIGDAVAAIAAQADVVLAVGTCAAFGGIPAAKSDTTDGRLRTGATDVGTYVHTHGSPSAVVVNVPGCPPNPDWIFGTVVHYLLGNIPPNLDSQGRPTFFYGNTNHGGRCPRYQAYCDGQFATEPGEYNSAYPNGMCLVKLGCKGFSTGADCAFGGPGSTAGRGWNKAHGAGHTPAVICKGSCINNGHPCMGCTEKGYPDKYSPFLTYTTG
jgi:hydrogenase small subunit